MSAERTYRRDNETRKTKAKIRAESKAGMYKGGGLGKAQGRKMAAMVEEADKKDAQKYGGMDMPTKEQAKKMAYGGKVKKMADGGKIRNSKPVPMPNPKRSEFKSNMPQIDGEAREKAMREKLKKSTPKRPRYDSKKILDKVTGRSASRRIASGGKVKKMAHGGSVSRGDGCAVRGKTKGRMV